ncbi:uncharacterized protein [Aegilops tauschii subsp. strangulata]|uniref:uncharacterized protein n=1 Tax=Aegilops tauschii subsp. strangulata TaxID=200361 RepID=UPI003CC8512C
MSFLQVLYLSRYLIHLVSSPPANYPLFSHLGIHHSPTIARHLQPPDPLALLSARGPCRRQELHPHRPASSTPPDQSPVLPTTSSSQALPPGRHLTGLYRSSRAPAPDLGPAPSSAPLSLSTAGDHQHLPELPRARATTYPSSRSSTRRGTPLCCPSSSRAPRPLLPAGEHHHAPSLHGSSSSAWSNLKGAVVEPLHHLSDPVDRIHQVAVLIRLRCTGRRRLSSCKPHCLLLTGAGTGSRPCSLTSTSAWASPAAAPQGPARPGPVATLVSARLQTLAPGRCWICRAHCFSPFGYVAIVTIYSTTLVRLLHGFGLLPSGISVAGTGNAML